MNSNPLIPGADCFAIPPPNMKTILHEMQVTGYVSEEIAIFEHTHAPCGVIWLLRKRPIFTVENSDEYSVGWTTEIALTPDQLNAMGKMMLGKVIGKVSGESLSMLAARDQLLMDLRVKLSQHLMLIVKSGDNQSLLEMLCGLQEPGNEDDLECMLTTIRLLGGLVASQLSERDEG